MDNESNTLEPPFITQSAEINELAGALCLAQGDMNPAKKGASNTFFKSSYVDLSGVIEASRYPLSANDLSIVQYCDNGYVVTQLMHSSGQWLRGRLRITPKDNTPQGIGSALSYSRRYSLQMMICQASGDPEDDDGEAAMGRAGSAYDPAHAEPVPKKKPTPRKKPQARVKKAEEPKTETVGEKAEEPATVTAGPIDTLDKDCTELLKAIPDANDYLNDHKIDPKKIPKSVKQRIVEKGLDGFGEMVAQWKMEKEGSA